MRLKSPHTQKKPRKPNSQQSNVERWNKKKIQRKKIKKIKTKFNINIKWNKMI
jgi:hypothetical protein